MNQQLRKLNSQPWRFLPGDKVYVRGWAPSATGLVTCQRHQRSGRHFPHYLVVDEAGAEWRIPQLHLSARPITADE